MVRVSKAVFLPALLVGLGLPGGAAAKDEPGVHTDPGSPAGKEYVIPLAGARREAAGGGNSSGGGGGGANSGPLFGAGIRRVPSHAGHRGAGGTSPRDTSGKSRKEISHAALASAPASTSSTSPALETGGIGLAVLVAGAGLGLLLRRGLRS